MGKAAAHFVLRIQCPPEVLGVAVPADTDRTNSANLAREAGAARIIPLIKSRSADSDDAVPAGIDRRWHGQLGDWLVAGSDGNWFVMSDAEFGRLRSPSARDGSQPGQPVAAVPAAERRTIAS